MALIHVYNGINKHTSYTFSGKIKDHINNVDWENSIILKGGYRIDENYEVQPDDVLYIRRTPAAGVDWAIVGVIASVTALVGAGVAVGISIYNANVADEKMKEAQKKNKALSENVDKLPFIKGARNQAATGRSFPYAIGESLMTPYRLCPPHYTIAGEHGDEQYYNVVLEVAYNNILIKKIKMGETIIKDFSGVSAPQNGQYTFDDGVYYDTRNLIEIRQTGAFTDPEFNKKIVLTELNTEIPHDHLPADASADDVERIEKEWQAGVVQELASHAQAVELIVLFDGLRQYDDGWKSQTITLRPQWTNVANPRESDWNDFTNGFSQNGTYNNTFTYNTKKQMRYVARQEFTAADAFNKNMKVRVIRTTPKADSSAKDSVYLLAVQTYCYDAKKSSSSQLVAADVLEPTERDKCCRIGVRVAANINTTGLLDAISVIESGCARTWNGTAWSSTKTPTRNLAAWVLELMTSPQHKPSQYDDAELDLASFGAWYTYCQQQGFNADGVITKAAKKKQIIETLCKNGNAALVLNTMTGLIEVAIDNGRDYSIALLNSENIISISTTKEFKRKTTGKKVTYINAAADYDADSVIFMRDGEAYDPATDTLTEAALEYVTDYQHAFKIAWRQMAEEIAQPKIYTIKGGRESAYYPIFSRVELQHKSLKIGIANGIIKALVWHSGRLQEIHLDGAVIFPATGACGVIVNCVSDNGRGLLALKVSGSGKTNILHVDTILRTSADLIPTAGNSISFGKLDSNGEFTTVTTTCKITNAEENDNGYTLTLVDYNPALYQYGTLPEYRSNLTSVPNSNAQTVENQREYITVGESQADASGAAQEALDLVTTGTRFTNIYKLKGMRGLPQTEAAGSNIPAIADTFETLRQELDEIRKEATDGISITDDKITIQVSDSETRSRALIEVTARNITQLVEDEKADTISIIEQTAAGITQQVQEIDGEVSTLQQTASGLTTQVENINTSITGINGDISVLNGDVSTLKQTASGLTTQVSEITQNVDTITGDVLSITGDVSTLQQTAQGLRVDVTDLDRETAATFAAMKNELIAMIDDGVRDTRAGMSITADEIVLGVENTEKNLRAEIDITAAEILAQVDDMAQELTGLIDVQAGAVQAIVEGGGAAGQMSLSLNLPVTIDATTRSRMIAASTAAKVNAVYGLIANTNYYGIKASASNAEVKALWNDAVAGGLLASQIELQADQIYLNGDVIINEQNKIKAALIDVENILTSNITVKDKGVIHSANYNGTIDNRGVITSHGTKGWAIDNEGNSDFYGINVTEGEVSNMTVKNAFNANHVYINNLTSVISLLTQWINDSNYRQGSKILNGFIALNAGNKEAAYIILGTLNSKDTIYFRIGLLYANNYTNMLYICWLTFDINTKKLELQLQDGTMTEVTGIIEFEVWGKV